MSLLLWYRYSWAIYIYIYRGFLLLWPSSCSSEFTCWLRMLRVFAYWAMHFGKLAKFKGQLWLPAVCQQWLQWSQQSRYDRWVFQRDLVNMHAHIMLSARGLVLPVPAVMRYCQAKLALTQPWASFAAMPISILEGLSSPHIAWMSKSTTLAKMRWNQTTTTLLYIIQSLAREFQERCHAKKSSAHVFHDYRLRQSPYYRCKSHSKQRMVGFFEWRIQYPQAGWDPDFSSSECWYGRMYLYYSKNMYSI